jgi:hypothetical protein
LQQQYLILPQCLVGSLIEQQHLILSHLLGLLMELEHSLLELVGSVLEHHHLFHFLE